MTPQEASGRGETLPSPMNPLTSDPYLILLGHNRWANRAILERSTPLTESKFHQRFEIGPGSLHDTMTHVIGAILRWCDRIEGRPLRARIDGRTKPDDTTPMTRRTPAELITLNDTACAEFFAVFEHQRSAGLLSEARDWTFGDQTSRFNVAAAIIHVTNHGMHHRAQCMNMLRHLGHPVNADLDELEWQVAGEP